MILLAVLARTAWLAPAGRTEIDLLWHGRPVAASVWYPTRILTRDRVSGTDELFPVLLYAPGWGGRRTDNASLAKILAASGYVVAALDDIATLLPAGDRLAGPMDFSSDAAASRTEAVAADKARLAASLTAALLDRLGALDAPGSGSRFSLRLDLARVGMFGFSFGGAVAAQSAWQDKRVRAVLNMDGWLFADAAAEGPGVPYFSMNDGEGLPGQAELDGSDPSSRNQARLTRDDARRQREILARSGGYDLTIAGSTHGDFIDQGWRAWLMDGFGQSHQVPRMAAAYAQAFFDHVLKGQASQLLRADAPQPSGAHFTVWDTQGRLHGDPPK